MINSGEMTRQQFRDARRQAHLAEQVVDAGVALAGGSAPVHVEGIAEHLPHRQSPVQRRRRVLEDHRDVRADHRAAAGVLHRPDVLAAERHGPESRALQADEHLRERRLAAAGLADHAHGLARRDGQVGTRQRVHAVAAEQPTGARLVDHMDVGERKESHRASVVARSTGAMSTAG
jgi:hypothetical protein